ncbi:MAG TPA: hypothetical protein VMM81_02140 [Acidimicrobiia bacterium]|nr:hypothetical protein [Acidimicrobiia bacterium]
MGQQIEIVTSTVAGDVLVVDTDRSITGQDGMTFASAADANAGDSFPARLAARLFEAIDDTAHVFVASNTVVVRRTGIWDAATVAAAEGVISSFFVFYRDETPVP